MNSGKVGICDCGDSLCQGSLGFHRGQDPDLYDLYARKLLRRGWAGNMTEAEKAFIHGNKVRSPKQKTADERFRERMQARRGV